jgi:hypothetical protein
MATWQFWTLIGTLVLLAWDRNGRSDTTAVVEWLKTINATLCDLRSQNHEIIETILRVPDDSSWDRKLENIERSLDQLRQRFVPTALEVEMECVLNGAHPLQPK